MDRFERSKSSPLTRDQFVELGQSMLGIANRQFGTPCAATVTCFTRNDPYALAFTLDSLSGHIPTILEIRREAAAITRFASTRIEDLRPEDMQKDGYIEISIRPVDQSKAPHAAWAAISTAGTKKGVAAYIQGGHVPHHDTLNPLTEIWNRQNPKPPTPRRWRDVVKQIFS